MFRFTIRDVLWLTVVVGMAVNFCIDRRYISALKRRADGLQQEVDWHNRRISEVRLQLNKEGRDIVTYPNGRSFVVKQEQEQPATDSLPLVTGELAER
jgi:hypothetical protein